MIVFFIIIFYLWCMTFASTFFYRIFIKKSYTFIEKFKSTLKRPTDTFFYRGVHWDNIEQLIKDKKEDCIVGAWLCSLIWPISIPITYFSIIMKDVYRKIDGKIKDQIEDLEELKKIEKELM